MNLCCPSSCIIEEKRPQQGIRDLQKAGFASIRLDIDVAFPTKDDRRHKLEQIKKYAPDNIAARYSELIKKCGASGVKIPVVHAPYADYASAGVDISDMLAVSAVESIKLCAKIGCTYLIVEPLYDIQDGNVEHERSREYYLRLAPYAEEYGVVILIKNQLKLIGGHIVRDKLSEPSLAAAFVYSLNEQAGRETFGFCLDTGRCNLCGIDEQAFVTALGRRLRAVVLTDNDGRHPAAMLPFTQTQGGQTTERWLGLMRGLREISFDGELIIDFTDTLTSFSPLLRPTLLKLAREVGDYFKWQVEIENNLKKYSKFVLFGAGNMCRGYMKCYGEKYPPLFTCDNNPRLWGTRFEGLEVKNPDELRHLPPDCAVIICNVYYREIEAQLKELGVKDIGYFNDEYMPSFHYDRIERDEY